MSGNDATGDMDFNIECGNANNEKSVYYVESSNCSIQTETRIVNERG